jgi:hypothetical protein
MTEDERNILKTLVNARTEAAILNLEDINPRYAEVCQQQERSWLTADEILKRLPDEDRRIVLRYYEDEVHKDAAYLQGVKDSVKVLMFFEVLGNGCRK